MVVAEWALEVEEDAFEHSFMTCMSGLPTEKAEVLLKAVLSVKELMMAILSSLQVSARGSITNRLVASGQNTGSDKVVGC